MGGRGAQHCDTGLTIRAADGRGDEPEHESYYEDYEEAYAAWQEWEPEWRVGYEPLQIAAGVTIVGQQGAVLSSCRPRLEVDMRACASSRCTSRRARRSTAAH